MSDEIPVLTLRDVLAYLDYCAVHAAQIYVRENLPGRGWGAYALSELPADVAIGWVRKWLAENRAPVLVRESGGSVSAGQTPAEMFSADPAVAFEPDPPVLNKSGGPDVELSMTVAVATPVDACPMCGRPKLIPTFSIGNNPREPK